MLAASSSVPTTYTNFWAMAGRAGRIVKKIARVREMNGWNSGSRDAHDGNDSAGEGSAQPAPLLAPPRRDRSHGRRPVGAVRQAARGGRVRGLAAATRGD